MTENPYTFAIATRDFNSREKAMIAVIDAALCGSPVESAMSVLTSTLLKGLMHIAQEDDAAFDQYCDNLITILKQGRLSAQAAGATKQ